jgi:hypothetical protein
LHEEFGVAVSKTALGIQVMKDRSVSMSAQQRSALILCDGKRTAEDVVRMTAAVGVTMQDIVALNAMGLIDTDTALTVAPSLSPSNPAVALGVPVASAVPASALPSDSLENVDFNAALNAAITLCSNLGFKGFSLNMALTGVDSLEKLQKLAPEIRRVAGDVKYKPLHAVIFDRSL